MMMPGSPPIAGVILAGGRSRRMGSDKAHVMLGGVSLLDRVIDRFAPQVTSLALNADEDSGGRLPLVPDSIPGKAGPLAGVLAAMHHSAAQSLGATHVATVPIDSPFFPSDLVSRLYSGVGNAQSIAIATSGGRQHPVFGLWPVALAADLERWLAGEENRRVRDFLLRHDVREISFPAIETDVGRLDPFFNINSPQDLAEAEKWLEVLT